MKALWIAWLTCAMLILAVFVWVGKVSNSSMSGLLIDTRGRYSLTRLQLSLWTLVVVSLTAGVFAAKATVRGVDPLGFSVPAPVLGVMGVSLGSAVIATGVKAQKNRDRAPFVAASPSGQARFAQVLLVEEGPQADKTVDVAKLQSFLITLFLVVAYVVLAVHTYAGWGPGIPITGPGGITSLPDFNPTFLTLLAISHAGYLGGKLPNRGDDTEQDVPENSVTSVNAQRTLDRRAGRATDPAAAAAARRAEQRARDLQNRTLSAPTRDDGPAAGVTATRRQR